MLRFIALTLILFSSAAQADRATRHGDWGSFLPPRDHRGAPDDRAGGLHRAPPVVTAPVFGFGRPTTLPNACLQSIDTPEGWRRFYDQDCLWTRTGTDISLPHECRVRLVTWGGTRRGYDAQCLFDAGFQREH